MQCICKSLISKDLIKAEEEIDSEKVRSVFEVILKC